MRDILFLGQTDMMSTAAGGMQCFSRPKFLLSSSFFISIITKLKQAFPSMRARDEMLDSNSPQAAALCRWPRPAPGRGEEGLNAHKEISGDDKWGLSQTQPALGLYAEVCG